MSGKEVLRRSFQQFFIIYTCTMLVSIIFCKVFTQPPVSELSVDVLWQVVIFSLCAVLPNLAYYSRRKLSNKEWIVRTVLHIVLLETVLMTAGWLLGMYRGWLGPILFFLAILAVNGIVRLITYLDDRETATKINGAIRVRRKSD